MSQNLKDLLGNDAEALLSYKAKFPKEQLNLPGPILSIEFLLKLTEI